MQALFNSSHRNRLHWVVFRIWQSKDLTESKYRTGFRAADSSPRCVTCVTCVTHAGIARYCHLCCLETWKTSKMVSVIGAVNLDPNCWSMNWASENPCDNCLTGLTRLSHWRRQCQPCPVQGVSHWNLGSNSRSRWSMVVLVQIIWEEKMRKIIKS